MSPLSLGVLSKVYGYSGGASLRGLSSESFGARVLWVVRVAVVSRTAVPVNGMDST